MDTLNLKNQVIKSPIEFENEDDDVVATFTAEGIRNVSKGVYTDTNDYVIATMDLNKKTIKVAHEDYPDSPSVFDMGIDDKRLEELRAWAEEKTTPIGRIPKTGGRKTRKSRKSKRRVTRKRAVAARRR